MNEAAPDTTDVRFGDSGWNQKGYGFEAFRLPEQVDPRDTSTSECLKRWYFLVDDFVNRKLSFQGDRLVAVSAIAREVGTKIGQPYAAGLWTQGLHYGLLWSIHVPGSVRPSEHFTPSWSWACLDFSSTIANVLGVVRKRYSSAFWMDHVLGQDAEILEIHVESANNDPFSRTLSGFLRVAGKCLEVCHCKIPGQFFDCHEVDDDDDQIKGKILDDSGLSMTYVLSSRTPHSQVLLFQIAARQIFKPEKTQFETCVRALILEETGQAGDQYRRVGKVIIALEDPILKETWMSKTVTLI